MDNPMDNTAKAPVIPAGTNTQGGVAYNSLNASVHTNQGQAQVAPNTVNPVGQAPQQANQSPTLSEQRTSFEELAAKKGFKSPDDLAKAYENLESHNKVVEMNMADILAARSPEPVDTAQAVTTETDALKIVESVAKKAMRPLQDKVELQDLFLNFPDAKEYAGGIAKAVKENPGISWNSAYKLAKYDSLQSKAVEQGKQEAYQNIAQKQAVQAGTPRPTVKENADLKSVIRDRSIPFSEITRIVKQRLQG